MRESRRVELIGICGTFTNNEFETMNLFVGMHILGSKKLLTDDLCKHGMFTVCYVMSSRIYYFK